MKSYKVYIENQEILFTDDLSLTSERSGEPTSSSSDYEPETVFLPLSQDESISFTKLSEKLRNTKKLTVISEDIPSVFDGFRRQFLQIEAGGGVVTDPGGNTLMIFRNGKWDLPKGKLEKGESIDVCALREVEEECGIGGLENCGHLIDTYHLYSLKGQWILKKTAWYNMSFNGCGSLCPQLEEGISLVEWIAPEDIPGKAALSYFTIRDVLQAAGKL